MRRGARVCARCGVRSGPLDAAVTPKVTRVLFAQLRCLRARVPVAGAVWDVRRVYGVDDARLFTP